MYYVPMQRHYLSFGEYSEAEGREEGRKGTEWGKVEDGENVVHTIDVG